MRVPTLPLRARLSGGIVACSLALAGAAALAQPAPAAPRSLDDTLVQAREALRKRDAAGLVRARDTLAAAQHPLAMWADYFELTNRLDKAAQPELEAFYRRWPGSYVEDRLRNDWLLELIQRRDWASFRTEFPRFRMNDDREVTCAWLLVRHLDGQDVRKEAREAWFAMRDAGEACSLMARTMHAARRLTDDDAWQEARLSVEGNRPRAVREAVALVEPGLAAAAQRLLDDPVRYLLRQAGTGTEAGRELALLALMRAAASEPEAVAELLQREWARRLPMGMSATAWAHVARHGALRLDPQAGEWARRAWQAWDASHKPGTQPPWSDEVLAWHVRAALREGQAPANTRGWALLARAIEAMSPAEQAQPAWVYWRARAALARAPAGAEGEAARAAARERLEGITSSLHFYGQLALEDLGRRPALPAAPAPLAAAERDAARAVPGLQRALALIRLGLRSEGVREWNFTLRGMPERELLAAAAFACEREVWDRCVNTSERTRGELDIAQRYPTPFREDIVRAARAAGLDPALVYGLIRQESRFIIDARSHVGASGLMQLMPATARWTARRAGINYTGEMINDREVNLLLGTTYLKLVLDDFQGSLAMAAAAYNAGPGRPRRWRETPAPLEVAAWAEAIPFTETRDYVQKVLANAVVYGHVLADPAAERGVPTLKARLGEPIAARPGTAPPADRNLP